jgi:hypothetical protein
VILSPWTLPTPCHYDFYVGLSGLKDQASMRCQFGKLLLLGELSIRLPEPDLGVS